jgi:hypothetical protein
MVKIDESTFKLLLRVVEYFLHYFQFCFSLAFIIFTKNDSYDLISQQKVHSYSIALITEEEKKRCLYNKNFLIHAWRDKSLHMFVTIFLRILFFVRM